MVERTNINPDSGPAQQAVDIVVPARSTQTADAATSEAVAREHRRRLVERELFPDMNQEDFDTMRSPRTFGA